MHGWMRVAGALKVKGQEGKRLSLFAAWLRVDYLRVAAVRSLIAAAVHFQRLAPVSSLLQGGQIPAWNPFRVCPWAQKRKPDTALCAALCF
ncbi:hypothetical protein [Ottowia massiliensis]|uniref:hypothetical protein n=1 Tax=Ottowia massiliensis TaxID=2045302 RepID=UPI0011AF3268|nr:hypothetical protein [Ottowia massiliensis]